MIAPHPSAKYAVVNLSGQNGYVICAVHAIDGPSGNQMVLISVQITGPGDTHVWAPPHWMMMGAVIAFCQTSEMASKYRRYLREQDREVEEANVR